jgi:hypothetical protein
VALEASVGRFAGLFTVLGPRKFGQLRRLLTQLYTITTPTNDQA